MEKGGGWRKWMGREGRREIDRAREGRKYNGDGRGGGKGMGRRMMIGNEEQKKK